MPAAAAIATRCIVWLVEPPVASSATTPLTTTFSSTSSPIGVASSATRPACSVRARRSGVPGLTKLAPGRCRPIASSTSWLEFAVP